MGKEFLAGLDPVISLNTVLLHSHTHLVLGLKKLIKKAGLMNSLLQAPINCLHFLAATVQTSFAGEQLFVSITQSLEEDENGKKKKLKNWLLPVRLPLFPAV